MRRISIFDACKKAALRFERIGTNADGFLNGIKKNKRLAVG